jgi:hypothetical protein
MLKKYFKNLLSLFIILSVNDIKSTKSTKQAPYKESPHLPCKTRAQIKAALNSKKQNLAKLAHFGRQFRTTRNIIPPTQLKSLILNPFFYRKITEIVKNIKQAEEIAGKNFKPRKHKDFFNFFYNQSTDPLLAASSDSTSNLSKLPTYPPKGDLFDTCPLQQNDAESTVSSVNFQCNTLPLMRYTTNNAQLTLAQLNGTVE